MRAAEHFACVLSFMCATAIWLEQMMCVSRRPCRQLFALSFTMRMPQCPLHLPAHLPACVPQANLRREVEELESQINNAGHVPTAAAAGNAPGALALAGKAAPIKSIVKLRAEKLEKSRALRLAQQVS